MEFAPTPANAAVIAQEIRLGVRRKLVLRPELREGFRLGLEAGLSTVGAVDLANAQVLRERAAVEQDWARALSAFLAAPEGIDLVLLRELLACAVEMAQRSATFLEDLARDQERTALASIRVDLLANA